MGCHFPVSFEFSCCIVDMSDIVLPYTPLCSTDGPAWIEVITELLLSMMFKDAVLSRNVSKVVMTALADHMTVSATELIVDVSIVYTIVNDSCFVFK